LGQAPADFAPGIWLTDGPAVEPSVTNAATRDGSSNEVTHNGIREPLGSLGVALTRFAPALDGACLENLSPAEQRGIGTHQRAELVKTAVRGNPLLHDTLRMHDVAQALMSSDGPALSHQERAGTHQRPVPSTSSNPSQAPPGVFFPRGAPGIAAAVGPQDSGITWLDSPATTPRSRGITVVGPPESPASAEAPAAAGTASQSILPSVGTTLHELGLCTPCHFWLIGACRHGRLCGQCHADHSEQRARHRGAPEKGPDPPLQVTQQWQ